MLVEVDHLFPIPLVDVDAVVVVQEVVFADGAHVGAQAFAGPHVEALEGDAFPLGGGLHDLGIDGVLVAIVGNVELDGRAGAVAIQQVVDAALGIDDERHGDHHEVERLAQVLFDEGFARKDGSLRVPGGEQGRVVHWQDIFEFGVVANAWPGKVGFLVEHKGVVPPNLLYAFAWLLPTGKWCLDWKDGWYPGRSPHGPPPKA